MSWNKSHVIVGVVSALVVALVQFLSFGATYGRLTQSVDDLGKRVAVLEKTSRPGTRIGDLCLKLMDAQNAAYEAHDSKTSGEVNTQLERLGCYKMVPADQRVDRKAAEVTGLRPH